MVGWIERALAVIAGVTMMAAVSALVARSEVPEQHGRATVSVHVGPTVVAAPTPVPNTPALKPRPVPAAPIAILETTALTAVHVKPDRWTKIVALAPPGTLLPVAAQQGNYLDVVTPDEVHGWVQRSAGIPIAPAGRPSHTLADATIVLDPGHGGSEPGAQGPSGLMEKDVNLDIARRVAGKLHGPRVILTRGANTAGLEYRSILANRLRADIFVSIHNNSASIKSSRTPGTETYFQQNNARSKRLAGIVYQELVSTFKVFHIKWGMAPLAGAKYRRGDNGLDYYSVLRKTKVPAVITEGMFIDNKPEEMLLRNGAVRAIYADALTRGIVKYFTTSDPGSGYADPYAKPNPICTTPGCFLPK